MPASVPLLAKHAGGKASTKRVGGFWQSRARFGFAQQGIKIIPLFFLPGEAGSWEVYYDSSRKLV